MSSKVANSTELVIFVFSYKCVANHMHKYSFAFILNFHINVKRIYIFQSFHESELKDLMTAIFLTFRAALADMQPGGRLIAMASIASLKGGANLAAYAGAKHGVLGLVRSLAIEVAKSGITCNAVCPGFVDTAMADGAAAAAAAAEVAGEAQAEAAKESKASKLHDLSQ